VEVSYSAQSRGLRVTRRDPGADLGVDLGVECTLETDLFALYCFGRLIQQEIGL
jgi:hypothetical protein